MLNALAAALFLGMAILFLGIAVTTGLTLAWAFTVINFLLSGLNLVVYMGKEARP